MSMLYPPEFWRIYGMGVQLQDATGREIDNVMAANLETGEVIVWCQLRNPMDLLRVWIRSLAPRMRSPWLWQTVIPRRHGFWPAPLTVKHRGV
jgi:hypothetical protein